MFSKHKNSRHLKVQSIASTIKNTGSWDVLMEMICHLIDLCKYGQVLQMQMPYQFPATKISHKYKTSIM